jgi:hypothetical protein
MPRRELKHPSKFEAWLEEWGTLLAEPGSLILIGSGGLLWHAAQRGLDIPLPENSMDVDPVTQSDAIALLGYEAMIGSEFERRHGWHVNLMPRLCWWKCRQTGWSAPPASNTDRSRLLCLRSTTCWCPS